ncbi:hypothetical protein WA1_05915 [Scytonema hofmannii PCC 7110]|uniref:Uncharacterized protein n=1 Tax=Scytonema hofmannii PCC 7110 TaxID=128403 RepID=A0A139WTT2_9CYAN|nr:hypothetical protein [Scytonema hofmannii]KYC35829.1 hypothetical protein WA1_05915 [Scytonema hofmannii PCC 7110]
MEDFQATGNRELLTLRNIIASAKRDEYAIDANFNDFSEGAFTYLFTQYLWQQTGNETFKRAIVNVGRSPKILAREKGNSQNPEFESNLIRSIFKKLLIFAG